jgi:cellulose synthase/poly-beta-1,6-N-acetylglucosamine synthase-like glycosyltransferase
MAYNEERNIGQLLEALVRQRTKNVCLREMIVVSSGCTDNTEAIVRQWSLLDRRVRLLVQSKREGKASAVNMYLNQTTEKIAVLCSADLMPEPDALERLLAPFADPEVGMTTARPVPVNDPKTFMGFAAHMLWGLHHRLNQTRFKAGEMIAFRKIFERIPYHTAVDEASIEPVIRGQGYKAVYVPDAIVHNKGPETLKDFLSQRRRIYAGHLSVRDTLGYSVSTMSGAKILKMVLGDLDWHPRQFAWTWAVAGLEVYGRILGQRDYKLQRNHTVWEIAKTTKQVGKEFAGARALAAGAAAGRSTR